MASEPAAVIATAAAEGKVFVMQTMLPVGRDAVVTPRMCLAPDPLGPSGLLRYCRGSSWR